jgi:malate dehydrogenase
MLHFPLCFFSFLIMFLQNFNVTILGAAGGIGASVSTLLKLTPSIGNLRLHDVNEAIVGISCDLSHMNTSARVSAHVGNNGLQAALTGAHVVVIPAGVARKPGMTRDDLFNTNAGIIKQLAEATAAYVSLFSFIEIS